MALKAGPISKRQESGWLPWTESPLYFRNCLGAATHHLPEARCGELCFLDAQGQPWSGYLEQKIPPSPLADWAD